MSEGRVPDPYEPGWRPDYVGPDEDLGDVGSGGEFGVDLYHLYYAGRERFPAVSVLYAEMTEQVHDTQPLGRGEFTRPDGGMHPAHTLWIELRDELQDVLRKSSINLWDTGKALVETAESYARTDAEAARAFADRLDTEQALGRFPITALPPEPAPPAPSDHTPLPPPPGEEAGSTPLPPPAGEEPGARDRDTP